MEDLKKLSTEELIKLLQESEAKVAKLEGENGELAKLEQELDKVKSDRDNLSAENEKLMERNTSLANENIEYKEKCAMLEVKIRDLNEELEKALKRNANSIQSNKNTAQRRYVTPSEKNRNIDFGPNVLNECEELAEKEKPGRKTGGLNLNNQICDKDLETVTIDFTDEELEVLNKEGRLERFGEDIFVKLIKQETKEVYKWVKVIRPKYINKATNKIVQKENTEAFKKCMVDSTVIADVINAKMNLGVPIERQAQYFQSMGIDLSSSLLSRYMMMAANSLQPIYDKLLESLVNNSNNVIHCDETPLKVLENQKERIWSYMFVLATSIWDRPIYIYDFNMTRKTDNIEEYLKDYRGYLTVDAYPGYDKFKDDYIPKSKELNTFNLAGVQSCITHYPSKNIIPVISSFIS